MKSVFRRLTREYAYYIEEFSYAGDPHYEVVKDRESGSVISDDIVAISYLGDFVFKVGTECRLHTTDETVTIKSAVRCTDGSMLYYVEDKLVETEASKLEEEEAQRKADEENDYLYECAKNHIKLGGCCDEGDYWNAY